jgi:phage terminase large subunit-like protein
VPGEQNAFLRLHLNVWTQQDTRWLSNELWDGGNLAPSQPLVKRPCYAGLDLSSTTDVTALELVFPDHDGGYDVLSFFWVPEDNLLSRARQDRVPYDQWQRQGFIEATEGNVVDYDVVRAKINELAKTYQIREIAIDRWNSTQLQTQLIGDGFTVVPFGQGFASMTAPTKELERLLLEQKLRHGGNPVLRWMASNVAVDQDAAGNLKPSKARSRERIDGIVALVMAIGRAMVQPITQPWHGIYISGED